MNYKFCTLEDVKLVNRQKLDYSTHDNLIESIIPLATKQVQDFCGRTFVEGVYVEYLPTIHTNSPFNIYLNEINIATDPAIVVKIDYSYPEDWDDVVALESRYYRLNAKEGILRLLASTCQHPEALQITYTAGYPADETDTNLIAVPENIALATALHAEFLFSRIINKELTLDNKRLTAALLANFNKMAGMGLIPQAANLVSSYKRAKVGRLY